MSVEEQLANAVQASNNLATVVNGKIGEIDSRLELAEQAYQQSIGDIRTDFPFYRMTKNQELKIGGVLDVGAVGIPDGWSIRSAVHKCEIVASSETGVEPDKKSAIIRRMYTDILGYIPKYTSPNFAVVRLTTDPAAEPNDISRFYSIYQGPIPNGIPHTLGGWIKAESGEVRFLSAKSSDIVPVDGKWHERTETKSMSRGGANYTHAPHIYLSPGSSCLLALPGVVAGKVPHGEWGFFNKPVFEHHMG